MQLIPSNPFKNRPTSIAWWLRRQKQSSDLLSRASKIVFLSKGEAVTYRSSMFCTSIQYFSEKPSPRYPFPPSSLPAKAEVLREEIAERQKGRASFSISKRYRGYEEGLLQKVVGVVKRAFYVIKKLSVKKGLDAYDAHLRNQPKILELANCSARSISNFDIEITPTSPFKKFFGRALEEKEVRATLHFTNEWHHNGPSLCPFRDGEKVYTLNQTVVSSRDKINDNIAMMRQVATRDRKRSVFYTGRCDALSKALEQVVFIFRSEMDKPATDQKKITLDPESRKYTLTYVVNNCMSAHGIGSFGLTGFNGFNERKSILDEQKVLEQLRDVEIDGKIVHLKPIYFTQTFNILNVLGTPTLQKQINERSYDALLHMACQALKEGAFDAKERALLSAAVQHLKGLKNLLAEEEFFYRDLICKLLDLPQVIHCKSCIDRTMIAGAISMATMQWRQLKSSIPTDHPHQILSEDLFKELFVSNILSGHDIARYARSSQKVNQSENSQLGFIWELNGTSNPVLLRMLPDSFKQSGTRPLYIKVQLIALRCMGWLFYSKKKVQEKIAFLESAYRKEALNVQSFKVRESKPPSPL